MYDKHGEESLEKRISSLVTFRGQDLSPPWPEVLALAEKLIGLPRYLSVHPGGVVITPNPIGNYVNFMEMSTLPTTALRTTRI